MRHTFDFRPGLAANFGRLVAQHHAFVIPTLSVLHSVCGDGNGELAADPRIASALSDLDVRFLKTSFPMPAKLSCAGAEAAVKQIHRAKVPILAGTDVPNPGTVQGASLHGELARLVQAGLTPAEALSAATAAPADAFHLTDRGYIAPGRRADLLLVSGDPTADITATRHIVAVWKAGVKVDPANLSSKKTISFWAKGDGKAYRIMVFAQSRGFMGITKAFTPSDEWKQFAFPIASFDGIDGHDIMGIVFAAGPQPGSFTFQIDELRIE